MISAENLPYVWLRCCSKCMPQTNDYSRKRQWAYHSAMGWHVKIIIHSTIFMLARIPVKKSTSFSIMQWEIYHRHAIQIVHPTPGLAEAVKWPVLYKGNGRNQRACSITHKVSKGQSIIAAWHSASLFFELPGIMPRKSTAPSAHASAKGWPP